MFGVFVYIVMTFNVHQIYISIIKGRNSYIYEINKNFVSKFKCKKKRNQQTIANVTLLIHFPENVNKFLTVELNTFMLQSFYDHRHVAMHN